MSDEIFANHAHLFVKDTKPNADIDCLKRLLDDCGIAGCVCFAMFPYQIEDWGIKTDANETLYNIIRDEKNLVGFGTVDFERDDIEQQVRKIYDLGFKGIKIHPAAQEVNIMGEKPRRVYAEAQKLGLFISFHTGLHHHRILDYNILLFDEIAWHYPGLKFSLEHIGGYSFFREALLVMNNNEGERVFGGLTSVNMEKNGMQGKWSLTDEEIRTLIYQTGCNKTIFGLDFPYHDAAYTKTAIDRIKRLDIPEEAKTGILGGNLKRVLGIN